MDLKTIIFVILLMVIAYTFRSLLYMRQANAVLADVRYFKRKWNIYAMGRGACKGMKSVVIIGADENLIVQEAKALSGVTVFARPKDYQALVGRSVVELSRIGNNDTPPDGIKKVIWLGAGMAAEYIMEHLPETRTEESSANHDDAKLKVEEAFT